MLPTFFDVFDVRFGCSRNWNILFFKMEYFVLVHGSK